MEIHCVAGSLPVQHRDQPIETISLYQIGLGMLAALWILHKCELAIETVEQQWRERQEGKGQDRERWEGGHESE